jgi:hypothetical protein
MKLINIIVVIIIMYSFKRIIGLKLSRISPFYANVIKLRLPFKTIFKI